MTRGKGRHIGDTAEDIVEEDLKSKGKEPLKVHGTNSVSAGMPDFVVPGDGYCEVKTILFTKNQVREFPNLNGVKLALVPIAYQDPDMKTAICGKPVYVDINWKEMFPE